MPKVDTSFEKYIIPPNGTNPHVWEKEAVIVMYRYSDIDYLGSQSPFGTY